MKKKNKEKKSGEMPEFKFKEFTPEENRIYEQAIDTFREAIAAGKKLKEAYESYSIEDPVLRSLIQADFLKILIAERHFGKGQSIEEVARDLSITNELIQETRMRMLQEVGMTAADQFGQEPKTND